MNQEQMTEELCASFPDMSCEDVMSGLGTVMVPAVVQEIAKKALVWAKAFGCPRRDQIIFAIQSFVEKKVSNPILAGMIMAAVSTAILMECGE